MNGPLKDLYFLIIESTDNPYDNQYIPIGSLMVRLLRTKTKSCTENPFEIADLTCYYSEYNEDTKMTSTISGSTYYTASENNINSEVNLI